MPAARMKTALATMMMALRHAMCHQTLTEQEDSFFANLPLLDVILSIKDRQPKGFLAPTWSEVNSEEAKTRGGLSARRAVYYASMIILTAMVTCAVGTVLLKANQIVQQRCRGAVYFPLQEQATTSRTTRILQKARVIVLFLGHVAVLTWCMVTSAASGELSPKLGLSWERWWFLTALACAWATAQVIWALLTCRATAQQLSLGTMPMSLTVYCCPLISDGYDTAKDIAFIGTLFSLDGQWLHALGLFCLLWLIGLYSVMIWRDDETEDAVLMSFASVATSLNKQAAEQALTSDDVADPQAAMTCSWSDIKALAKAKMKTAKERALIVAFFQTTRQKRKLLLLEDGVQGACAFIAIFGSGGGISTFLFIFIMNIALPACKWIFAWGFHSLIAEKLQGWLCDEAEVARTAGLMARFQSLHSKLLDVMEVDVESEEWFPESKEVNDNHARVVAWSLQDSEAQKWAIQNRALSITTKGWQALMASDGSKEAGLKILVLKGIKDVDINALATTTLVKDCPLQELVLENSNIDAARVQTLAHAIVKQDCGLRKLGLKNNNIGYAGIQALAEAIANQECCLTDLDLDEENGLDENGVLVIANAIGLQDRFHSLRAKLLDMMRPTVESEEMWFPGSTPVIDGHAYLVAWTLKDSTVHTFVIKERPCHITQRGWEVLMVSTDSSQDIGLKKLLLNHVSDLSMDALLAALVAKDCLLEEMVLENNAIGDAGVEALANAIANQDCGLRKLGLKNNDIDDASAQVLANAIGKKECQLMDIDLEENGVGDEGAAAMANAIGLQDRFHSLRAKLIDIIQLNVVSEEVWFPGSNAVTDGHAYRVAWTIKDSAAQTWVIKDRPCHVTQTGWEALMVVMDTSLKKLVLNHVNDLSMDALTATLATRECRLSQLYVTNSGIGDEGAESLALVICLQECSLLELGLESNSIGNFGALALADAIEKEDFSLRELHLQKNRIRKEGALGLASAVSTEDCSLQELGLEMNPVGLDGLHMLRHQIPDRFQSMHAKMHYVKYLKKEDYRLNRFVSSQVNDNFVDVVAWTITDNYPNFLVRSQSCQITTEGWKALLGASASSEEITQTLKDLRFLEVNEDDMAKSDIVAIVSAIATKDCSLRTLSFIKSPVSIERVRFLADAISKEDCKLACLALRCCNIGDQGATALANAICLKDCSLKELDLDDNGLGDAAADALAKAIATQDCSLQTLSLSDNRIGSAGARAFAHAISKEEMHLEYLYISRNRLKRSDIQALRYACPERSGSLRLWTD